MVTVVETISSLYNTKTLLKVKSGSTRVEVTHVGFLYCKCKSTLTYPLRADPEKTYPTFISELSLMFLIHVLLYAGVYSM